MPRVQRASDIIEIISEKAFFFGIAGVAGIGLGAVFLYYRGSGMFVPLGSILEVIGVGCLGYAGYTALQTRKVTTYTAECSYCQAKNVLTEQPSEDFSCISCHRMVPVLNGKVLPVQQVRCGFCNELNYYSEKTGALLCESCNHEIPISQDEGVEKKVIPSAYAVVDDDAMYELVLVEAGNKDEALIQALQHMLALNRNQVKQMLEELPVTLLTGITRKKAEILKAQLSIHDGVADFRQMEEVAR